MPKAAIKLLLALLFACGASLVDAFPVFWPAKADIAPWAPTPTDHVILSISDTFLECGACSEGYPASTQVSRDGNVIAVTVTWAPSGIGTPPGCVGCTFPVDLGALPLGQYTVNYFHINDFGVPSAPGSLLLSIGFTVSAQGYAAAIEYFAPSLDHYFVTSDSAEIAALDSGVIPGWTRTGESFHVIPAAVQPTTAASVCRFYGLPQAGLNSHFFSASQAECAAVQQLYPNAWLLETADAFAALPVPEVDCQQGAVSLYRLYNNRSDANHRYTTSPAIRDQMVAMGWLLEGNATQHGLTAMCVPE
jgi:hypothetical protein